MTILSRCLTGALAFALIARAEDRKALAVLEANCQSCHARRDVSTVAPQALALLNSEFMWEHAEAFAACLKATAGEAAEALVRAGWLAAGREPSREEMQVSLRPLEKGSPRHFGLMLFNLSEFVYVD
jgi:hypothetical protein